METLPERSDGGSDLELVRVGPMTFIVDCGVVLGIEEHGQLRLLPPSVVIYVRSKLEQRVADTIPF